MEQRSPDLEKIIRNYLDGLSPHIKERKGHELLILALAEIVAIQAERDAKDSIIEGLRAQLQCDGTNHRFHETSTFEIKALQCGCGLYYHDERQGEIDALKAELKKQNTESAIQYGKMMIERNHEVASLTTENLALQGALETIREKAITNEIHRLADNALKSAREAGLVKP